MENTVKKQRDMLNTHRNWDNETVQADNKEREKELEARTLYCDHNYSAIGMINQSFLLLQIVYHYLALKDVRHTCHKYQETHTPDGKNGTCLY